MLKEEENRLFADWKDAVVRETSELFVTDGVVDEQEWKESPIKVLYLLKEVNGADTEWDERDYLKKYNVESNYIKTHSPTVNVISQWQYGIAYKPDATWKDVEQVIVDTDLQTKLLSQICLVNIKKTAGESVVDWNKFEVYFKNPINLEMLNKQLDLYHPDVVVCGGTAWLLCQVKGWEYNKWLQTTRGIRYYRDRNTVYIDFCHPNNRGPKNMIFFSLLDALKEIREMEN